MSAHTSVCESSISTHSASCPGTISLHTNGRLVWPTPSTPITFTLASAETVTVPKAVVPATPVTLTLASADTVTIPNAVVP